jgi:hypothetical protein
MLSAYWINAHISKPAPWRHGWASYSQQVWTESYDFIVEFQTAKSVELAIFVIRGCTPTAQHNRCEFSA